jgi:hypothetical protein
VNGGDEETGVEVPASKTPLLAGVCIELTANGNDAPEKRFEDGSVCVSIEACWDAGASDGTDIWEVAAVGKVKFGNQAFCATEETLARSPSAAKAEPQSVNAGECRGVNVVTSTCGLVEGSAIAHGATSDGAEYCSAVGKICDGEFGGEY